jgi:hypothetical protein
MALCDESRIKKNECNKTEIGEYIVAANATDKAKSQILTTAVDLSNPKPVKYQIKKTGYYCLFTSPFNVDEYKAVVEWRNAYGELSATQIPKLPFYGGITVVYALLACYWGFLYYQHRHDIRGLRMHFEDGMKLANGIRSGGPELHHRDPGLPSGGDVRDLGLLRYVYKPQRITMTIWLTTHQNKRTDTVQMLALGSY